MPEGRRYSFEREFNSGAGATYADTLDNKTNASDPLPKISRGVSDSLQSSVAGDGVWRRIQSIFSLDVLSYVKIVDKLQQR